MRRWVAIVAAPMLAGCLVAGCNSGGRPTAETELTETANAEPAAGAQTPGLYRAFPGDTVYGVAQRFGVPVRTLIETNNLKPPYRLEAGQSLHVPVREEHVVQPGETLFSIAQIYGVDQSSLAQTNNLTAPYAVKPGQHLTLPGRIDANNPNGVGSSMPEAPLPPAASGGPMTVEQLPPPTGAPAAPSSKPPVAPSAATPPGPTPSVATPAAPQAAAPTPPPSPPPQTATIAPEPAPRSGASFLWPAKGKVISNFGSKPGGLHNDGINIEAPEGASVVAAENGVVAYAGNELRGFGNLLLIRHAGGWVTAYAHNDRLLVKRGDRVTRGQVIARVGKTGNVASPQLHFEIRKGTDPVDPLKYLQGQGAAASPGASPAAPPGPG